MALGASQGSERGLVLKNGAILLGMGLGLGLLGPPALSDVFSAQLFGASSRDPLVLGGFSSPKLLWVFWPAAFPRGKRHRFLPSKPCEGNDTVCEATMNPPSLLKGPPNRSTSPPSGPRVS